VLFIYNEDLKKIPVISLNEKDPPFTKIMVFEIPTNSRLLYVSPEFLATAPGTVCPLDLHKPWVLAQPRQVVCSRSKSPETGIRKRAVYRCKKCGKPRRGHRCNK